MPIKADTKSKTPPVAAGTYTAVCYGVLAVGTQAPKDSKFPPKKKVIIVWELPDERGTFDGKDQPRAVSKKYTLSLNEKASLRKDLESWRGRQFTDAELGTFEIDRLIGANCMLNIIHVEKAGNTYVNVAGVVPVPKGMPKRGHENNRLYFNLEEAIDTALVTGEPVEFPATMPEWMVEMAKESEEYKAFLGRDKTVADEEEAPAAAPDDEEVMGNEPVAVGDALKGSVPF